MSSSARLRQTTSALVLLAVGLLVGCTDDVSEPPPPPPDTNDAQITEGLADLWAGDNPTSPNAAAACFGTEFASRTTPEQLRETGLIDEGGAVVTAVPVLDPDVAGVWVDAQFTCVDYAEESARALSTQSRRELDETAYVACLGEAVTETQMRAAIVAGLSGDVADPRLDVVSRAQLACAEKAGLG